MTNAIYKVEGMSCQGCERSVENAIRKVLGVESVKASSAKGTVEVGFQSDSLSPDIIRDAIERSGYKYLGIQ